jgi:hypothetical protein
VLHAIEAESSTRTRAGPARTIGSS